MNPSLFLDLCFIGLGRFLLSGFSFLLLGIHLPVQLDGILELSLKTFEVFLGGEFRAKFLGFRFFIRNVVGCPGPGVVAGFELFELAEDVLIDDKVVHDAFVSLFSSHQNANIPTGLVPEEAELTDSSFLPFLPEPVDLGAEFCEFFLLFFTGDFGHLRKVDKLPVANDFLLDIFVFVT